MSRFNNVDLAKIEGFAEQIRQEPAKSRKTQVIEGEWLLGHGGPQFKSTVTFEGGEATFEVDNPTFMGGGGTLPGPMHYCFYGLASCYIGVFAATASAMVYLAKTPSMPLPTPDELIETLIGAIAGGK